MRNEYLLMMDTDKTGRVFSAKFNRVFPFDSMRELSERVMEDMDSEYSEQMDDRAMFSVEPGEFITLRAVVVSVDECGLHGYILSNGERDVFKSNAHFYKVIGAHISIEETRRRLCETVRRSRMRKLENSYVVHA